MNRSQAPVGKPRARKSIWQPLYAFELYWTITAILYLVGPVSFDRRNVQFVVILLIAYQGAFALGYGLGIAPRHSESTRLLPADPGASLRFVRFSIALGFAISVANLIVYTDVHSLQPSAIIEAIRSALADPGIAYEASFDVEIPSRPGVWAIVFVAPVSWSSFALAVAFFDRIGLRFQVLTVAMFILEASRWIILGHNKGAFDLVIIIAVVLWVKHARREMWGDRAARTRRRRLSSVLAVAVLLYIALTYFTNAISSRTNQLALIEVRDAGPLLHLLPEGLRPTLISVTSYLAQGYHALSFAGDLSWVPTYGVGHSLFLMANIEELFGIDVFERTYQARMIVFGISPTVNWHSSYLWAANDVHWLGVVLVMAFFGWVSARVVKMSIEAGSIAAYPLLALLAIQAAYVPANAQVFQEPVTFVAFWGLAMYFFACKARLLPKKLQLGIGFQSAVNSCPEPGQEIQAGVADDPKSVPKSTVTQTAMEE